MYVMKKWIFLLFFADICFGGEPPFSNLRRKPSLSPYLILDENLDLRYHQEVKPFLEKQKPNQSFQIQNKSQNNINNFRYPDDKIRPTGHPTYFMHIPYYNFR